MLCRLGSLDSEGSHYPLSICYDWHCKNDTTISAVHKIFSWMEGNPLGSPFVLNLPNRWSINWIIPMTIHSHDDSAYSNRSLLVLEQVCSKVDQPTMVLGKPTLALLSNLYRNESGQYFYLYSFFIIYTVEPLIIWTSLIWTFCKSNRFWWSF